MSDSYHWEDEFWWFPTMTTASLFCYLGRTDTPVRGEDDPTKMYFAWTGTDNDSHADLIPIEDIPKWWAQFEGVNVHRSLIVFEDALAEYPLFGPFFFDIDGG